MNEQTAVTAVKGKGKLKSLLAPIFYILILVISGTQFMDGFIQAFCLNGFWSAIWTNVKSFLLLLVEVAVIGFFIVAQLLKNQKIVLFVACAVFGAWQCFFGWSLRGDFWSVLISVFLKLSVVAAALLLVMNSAFVTFGKGKLKETGGKLWFLPPIFYALAVFFDFISVCISFVVIIRYLNSYVSGFAGVVSFFAMTCRILLSPVKVLCYLGGAVFYGLRLKKEAGEASPSAPAAEQPSEPAPETPAQ